MVQGREPAGWSERTRVARACLKKTGVADGDDVRREFARLLQSAGLPAGVTPKALRHHFATALERADVPYYTRKYLLGHRLGEKGGRGGDVTAVYTHLEPDLIKTAYQRVIDGPLAEVLKAYAARLAQLGCDAPDQESTSHSGASQAPGESSSPAVGGNR